MNIGLSRVLKNILAVLFLISHFGYSQPNYLMSIQNGSRINNKTFEFEICIKTNSASFLLTSYQCALRFNTEILNGGTVDLVYIPGTSQLSNIPFYGIGINTHDGEMKLTFASLVGTDTINSNMKCIGKFRLINSAGLGGSGINLSWCFSGAVNTILTGAAFQNITNPNYHSNFEMLWDSIPPSLQNISTLNSNTLLAEFSEPLDSTDIRNPNNYSITQGINVLTAEPNLLNNQVTLNTSPHDPGNSYIVRVSNLSDLSGNMISSSGNSASYTYFDSLSIEIKVFLQGPFQNGMLRKCLNERLLIPNCQPFNTAPWNYHGTEQVTAIPAHIVDWILVELRQELSSESILARRAAFINHNGFIVDLDGSSSIRFTILPEQYYLTIKHRNHLGIISANKVTISDSTNFYDFTVSDTSTYGINSQVNMGNGIFAMYSGDADGNGAITYNDLEAFWKRQNGKVGYNSCDLNLNGGINIEDKNSYLKINLGRVSNIP